MLKQDNFAIAFTLIEVYNIGTTLEGEVHMEKRRVIKDLSWSVPYDTAVKFLRVSEDDEEEFKDIYDEVLPLLEPVCYLGEDAIEHNDGH